MKPKKPWSEDNARLRRLYLEHVPKGMTQEQFGKLHGIGSQGMVAQHLNGVRPLTYEAASKYARGLRCTIYDISPSMGDVIRTELLPVLGRPLRQAAMLLLALFAVSGPSEVHATAMLHNTGIADKVGSYYTMIVKWARIFRCAFLHKFYTLWTPGIAQA